MVRAPTQARARELVAASGTRGAAVTVWAPGFAEAAGREIVRALAGLGYRSTLRLIASADEYFNRWLYPHSDSIQIGFVGWIWTSPAPSGFMLPLFSCSGGATNTSHFCDPAI